MANMSYCRFENTLSDLRDCYDHMDEGDYLDTEERSRIHMIKLCKQIVDDFSYEIE